MGEAAAVASSRKAEVVLGNHKTITVIFLLLPISIVDENENVVI